MTAKATDDPLILARSLTRHAEQLCNGLESGTVDLYDLVTPTTAQLLHWWFGEDACQTRAFNFHPGQRQAILNTIVAHEVLGTLDCGTRERFARRRSREGGTSAKHAGQPQDSSGGPGAGSLDRKSTRLNSSH